jgi:hypothetical protein
MTDLGASRVILEPELADHLAHGRTTEAEAIRAELAARTWQNLNPYAGWTVPA